MRSTNQLKQRLSTSTVRTAYALVVRGVILLSLVWAVLGQHPSPAVVAAGSASGQSDVRADTGPIAETVVRLSAEPVAFADAAKTRRVFVATTDPHDQNRAGVVVLDAASGKVLNSVSLRVPGARAGQAGGGPSPVGIACPGCVAVDRRSGRVFVLTSGPLDRAGNPTGFPRMFVLDATTGKVVGTSALTAHRATLNLPTGVVVDERSNRVFVGYGDSENMAVLDATTGKLLRTVTFPIYNPPDLGPVVPLGVDSHDARVVVAAPNGLATVDERTGGDAHYVSLRKAQGVLDGVVDGLRGRAVISAAELRAGTAGNDIDTINLADGHVVSFSGTGTTEAGQVLAVDEPSGQAMVFLSSARGSGQSAFLTVVDDVTGRTPAAVPLLEEGSNGRAMGAVNPATGHGLLLLEDDQFAGPTHLLVVDLRTGKKLRDLPVRGVTMYQDPAIVADGRTHRVFVTNSSENTVTMFDGTRL